MLFHSDGHAAIANAGYIPPLLDGAEVLLDADLPLGITNGVHYAESPAGLGQHRLIFLSDGVIEATDSKGE